MLMEKGKIANEAELLSNYWLGYSIAAVRQSPVSLHRGSTFRSRPDFQF
jgi:hypothetical protein